MNFHPICLEGLYIFQNLHTHFNIVIIDIDLRAVLKWDFMPVKCLQFLTALVQLFWYLKIRQYLNDLLYQVSNLSVITGKLTYSYSLCCIVFCISISGEYSWGWNSNFLLLSSAVILRNLRNHLNKSQFNYVVSRGNVNSSSLETTIYLQIQLFLECG